MNVYLYVDKRKKHLYTLSRRAFKADVFWARNLVEAILVTRFHHISAKVKIDQTSRRGVYWLKTILLLSTESYFMNFWGLVKWKKKITFNKTQVKWKWIKIQWKLGSVSHDGQFHCNKAIKCFCIQHFGPYLHLTMRCLHSNTPKMDGLWKRNAYNYQ